MAKNKGFEPTPAEKYLNQLDPDRAQIRHRDLLYATKEETDSLYRPVHNYKITKLNRIQSFAVIILLPSVLILIISDRFNWNPFVAFFLNLIVLFIWLILYLAARDGLRPKKKDPDDEG